MTPISFTMYDILAYVTSGSLLLAAVDYTYGNRLVLREELPLPSVVMLLFLSYMLGHVVASFSELVLQDLVVCKWIGVPSEILMGGSPHPIARRLFPRYLRALPEESQRRVRAQAASRDFSGSGESLFLHAFAAVCQFEAQRKRLDEFRNLYGFSRNVSFSLILAALTLGSGCLFAHDRPPYVVPVASLVAGAAMFARFRKFYRQYTYQLLITYAELPLRRKENAK